MQVYQNSFIVKILDMSMLKSGKILVATVGKYSAGIQPELSSPSRALVHLALSGPSCALRSTLRSRVHPALSGPIPCSRVHPALWGLSRALESIACQSLSHPFSFFPVRFAAMFGTIVLS